MLRQLLAGATERPPGDVIHDGPRAGRALIDREHRGRGHDFYPHVLWDRIPILSAEQTELESYPTKPDGSRPRVATGPGPDLRPGGYVPDRKSPVPMVPFLIRRKK